MISQYEMNTLDIYVYYKVSKNIKIVNWYCKHMFKVVIIMVKFMQISCILRFIRKKVYRLWFVLSVLDSS